MISVIFALAGLWMVFLGSYWWALLLFLLAMSVRGTLVIGFFMMAVLLMWAYV